MTAIWTPREDEPDYAFLSTKDMPELNFWDTPVDLITRSGGEAPVNREMKINGEDGIGCNPNRNKQHAFHFTADNCIGCHACEAACSEKNDNPAHISFRSVGYVESGEYPDFRRMNISMACNHCDDPVCLKGCPTRAYTKHAEYGAVLQDPDTCFGCGYCTWVCPYNAPQLDPIKGQVSKCNMCVDRLEENLKPACVSACLGNALNFGVVDDLPDNRDAADVRIPGFPDPTITRPNIRFQQHKELAGEVTRPDGMPVKYAQQADGAYKPVVDAKQGVTRHWNLRRLSSRENPLVVFTLALQAAIGAFFIVTLGSAAGVGPLATLRESDAYLPLLFAALGLVATGLLMSAVHLGKPMRFYRGFNNLRWSPVAREGAGVALFFAFGGLHFLSAAPDNSWVQDVLSKLSLSFAVPDALKTGLSLLALLPASVGMYYMIKCYRIPARPFWDHYQVATSFIGSALALGSLLIAVVALPVMYFSGLIVAPLLMLLAVLVAAGAALEGLGLIQHARAMSVADNEGAVSHYIQRTTFGKTYVLRNVLLALVLPLALMLALSGGEGGAALIAAGLTLLALLPAAIIGRALFYVLVVPTTMPGAFFWKNKDFEEHARDIGLADMPQVGVVPHRH